MASKTLLFHLTGPPGAVKVSLCVDGGPSAEGAFEWDDSQQSQIGPVLTAIEEGLCSTDDLRYVGSLLWSGLLSEPVEELIERVRRETPDSDTRWLIRLRPTQELEYLPWEALYRERELSFLATDSGHRVIRDNPERMSVRARRRRPRRPGPLRMLVVIPENSGLGEADEWHRLRLAIGSQQKVELKCLEGRVTVDRLREALDETPWDVVHYIGHGELTENEEVQIRLNGETKDKGDHWIEAEAFASLFRDKGVRLVVLNSCHGSAYDATRHLNGASGYLLRDGVLAVIAMRYEIRDETAVKFAEEFYRELLGSSRRPRGGDTTAFTTGDVADALLQARITLYQGQKDGARRTFITPLLHLAEDVDPHILDLPTRDGDGETDQVSVEDHESSASAAGEGAAAAVDAELIQSLTNGDCLIIIGPDLAGPVLRRAGAPSPRLHELVMRLATDSHYPEQQNLSLADAVGQWVQGMVLGSVCQHFEYVTNRVRLVRAVMTAYNGCQPSAELVQVARWGQPGIIYLHFDGMMEDAFREQHITPRTISAQSPGEDLAENAPLLLNLFGTLKDPYSLILTDDDRERLQDQIGQLPAQIKALVQGRFGRSLLYLGVSPRDPLVRRLNSQLQKPAHDQGFGRTQGPTFFACASASDADSAYWKKFDVRWLPGEPHEIVAAVDQALKARRRDVERA